MMFVDTALLHAGASESVKAGEHAQDGADHLSRRPLPAGMFGGFAAAEAFHQAVSSAQAYHLRALRSHQHSLGVLADKAQMVAAGFTAMEHDNAEELRELGAPRWGCAP